jgi:hypothetical protein
MPGGGNTVRGSCAPCKVIWHWQSKVTQRDALCPKCRGALGPVTRKTIGENRDGYPLTRELADATTEAT